MFARIKVCVLNCDYSINVLNGSVNLNIFQQVKQRISNQQIVQLSTSVIKLCLQCLNTSNYYIYLTLSSIFVELIKVQFIFYRI